MFNKSSKSSPPPSSTNSSTPMTPRHAALESSFPAAFFGKKRPSASATPITATEKTSESDRRMSVSSTATTATASSVSSEATTIAAAPSISEKRIPQKQEAKQQAQPFDPFTYQSAGYLSMPLNHKDQPYLQHPPNSSSASSSRKNSSSSSSSSSKSLWQKTKNLTQKRRSSEEREKAKKEYEELGLEEKTKFGMGEGGMRMVG